MDEIDSPAAFVCNGHYTGSHRNHIHPIVSCFACDCFLKDFLKAVILVIDLWALLPSPVLLARTSTARPIFLDSSVHALDENFSVCGFVARNPSIRTEVLIVRPASSNIGNLQVDVHEFVNAIQNAERSN